MPTSAPGARCTHSASSHRALELALPLWLIVTVDRVHVKDWLGNIHSGSGNLQVGLLLIL